ncbi:MAG: type II secretion system F family protein [Chloroflexota bacterium]
MFLRRQGKQAMQPQAIGTKEEMTGMAATTGRTNSSRDVLLELLKEQAGNRPLGHVLTEVTDDLRKGSSLSDAIKKHPLAFSALYALMVEVGEMTGGLEKVLRQLATYLEREQTVAGKTKRALAYPVAVLLMALGVGALMVTVTLPPVVGMFQQFKTALPPATQFLLAMIDFFQAWGLRLAIALAALAAGAIWYIQRPEGRRRWHFLLLKTPLLGSIVADNNVARIARTVSILIRGGVPLPETLVLAQQVTGNEILRDVLRQVQVGLSQGRGLAEPMARSQYFPRLMVTMVRIGEEAGTLDSNLETVAAFLEAEVEGRTELIISLIEPGLTIVVGIIIGFLAIAVVMPMFSLTASFR